MALTLGDNFSYLGTKPLDGRIKYSTIAEMVAMSENTLYNGIIAYCEADGKNYQYKSTNDVDVTLGKWREFSSGGGAVDSVNGKTGVVVLDAEDVGALPDDTDIPSNTSDLTNDSGFIINTVNNLVNYYLKSETYTQAEVNALISAIVTLDIQAVSVLPTENISRTTIYLVPSTDPQIQNIKDEYINLDGTSSGWELIGSTEIDLTGYVTDAELTTALANYTTTANLTALLDGKVDKVSGKQLSTEDYTTAEKTKLASLEPIQVSTMPEASVDYIGTIYQYIGETSTYTKGYFYECKITSSRTVTIFAPEHSSTSDHPRTYTEDNVVKGGTGNIYSDIECTNQYGTWQWTNTSVNMPTLNRGSDGWFGTIEEVRTINTYEWKVVSISEVDFDDLTNRPLESDAIDISELDLPMPAKPTDYPILFDESGTEYQVGWYKRASDGKVKPVWRKYVNGTSTSGTYTIDVSSLNIDNPISLNGFCRVGTNGNYIFGGNSYSSNTDKLQYYLSANKTTLYLSSGSSAIYGAYALTFYYTKTSDEWKEV